MKTKMILPKVLLCKGADGYDLAMHFLRYQEYYESPNPKFRGKGWWRLVDFMDWYRKSRKEPSFTYPADWGGFNVSAAVVHQVWGQIPDPNSYDAEMKRLAHLVGAGGYLIGAQDLPTVRHELAHGLYYTNLAYRHNAVNLVLDLKAPYYRRLKAELRRMGYASEVINDEIQAYMATGLTDKMKVPAVLRKPFVALFKAYTKGVL